MFPPTKLFNGAARSVKHERGNVNIRVRGKIMTKVQELIYGIPTPGVYVEWCTGSNKMVGVKASFPLR